MPGLYRDRGDDGKHFAAGVLAVTLGKAWTPRLQSFVELAGQRLSRAQTGESLLNVDTGLAFVATKTLQVDVVVSRSLSGNASQEVRGGLSVSSSSDADAVNRGRPGAAHEMPAKTGGHESTRLLKSARGHRLRGRDAAHGRRRQDRRYRLRADDADDRRPGSRRAASRRAGRAAGRREEGRGRTEGRARGARAAPSPSSTE